MFIRNYYLSVGYKILFLILCSWGLFLNFGLAHGEMRWYVLNYYTLLSNLLCLIFFIFLLIVNVRRDKVKHAVRLIASRGEGAVVFCITVTMLIYNFVLAPIQFSMGNGDKVYSISNLLVHYIVPTLVILDWLLFDAKGVFKKYDPFLWIIIPYLYFIYIVIRAQFAGVIPGTSSSYPYRFINADLLGWDRVFVNVGVLTLIFLAIGYLFYFIDWLSSRFSKA